MVVTRADLNFWYGTVYIFDVNAGTEGDSASVEMRDVLRDCTRVLIKYGPRVCQSPGEVAVLLISLSIRISGGSLQTSSKLKYLVL